MTTPIEAGAKAVWGVWVRGGMWSATEVTKAVFGSIDEDGLTRVLAGRTSARHGTLFDLGHETTVAMYLDYAREIKAWLNRSEP